MAHTVKNLPAVLETWVQSLGWEGSLEDGLATHSSILAWRTPVDRGAWQATVQGVTKSRAQLGDKHKMGRTATLQLRGRSAYWRSKSAGHKFQPGSFWPYTQASVLSSGKWELWCLRVAGRPKGIAVCKTFEPHLAQ